MPYPKAMPNTFVHHLASFAYNLTTLELESPNALPVPSRQSTSSFGSFVSMRISGSYSTPPGGVELWESSCLRGALTLSRARLDISLEIGVAGAASYLHW